MVSLFFFWTLTELCSKLVCMRIGLGLVYEIDIERREEINLKPRYEMVQHHCKR